PGAPPRPLRPQRVAAGRPPPAHGRPRRTQQPRDHLPPRRRQPPNRPPHPADEIEPASQRVVNNAALFTGLDKITGRIINFDVAIGETVQFGAVQLTPRACYTRPATQTAKPDAIVEGDALTLHGEVRHTLP